MKNLIKKYNLSTNSCLNEEPISPYEEGGLVYQWEDYVGNNWYGFDLPQIPITWHLVIGDILLEAVNRFSEMEIHQIKVKFGYLNIYLGNISPEFAAEIQEITGLMFDERLVY